MKGLWRRYREAWQLAVGDSRLGCDRLKTVRELARRGSRAFGLGGYIYRFVPEVDLWTVAAAAGDARLFVSHDATRSRRCCCHY